MKIQLLWLMAAGLPLSSCVVYMPMQCAAPAITDKKHAEVSGSTYLNGRWEVAGSYSPVKHLLVRAAYSTKPYTDNTGNSSGVNSRADSSSYHGQQYDVGLGTYWRLGPDCVVGALGGFGQGRAEAAFARGQFFGPPIRSRYDMRFNKIFGEAYITFEASKSIALGAAYRLTQVRFTTLTNQTIPVAIPSMTRSEPMLYFRVLPSFGAVNSRPLHIQLAVGSSQTIGYSEKDSFGQERDIQQGRMYTTLSLSVFPHQLFRKDKSEDDLAR